MAKVSLLLALLLTTRARSAGSEDPREIVRRSVAAEVVNSQRARDYTFLQRTEERELDSSSEVKSRKSKTWDVTMLEGSSYRRLVERDDQPLPPAEEKKEQEKLRKSIEERRHETRRQRQRRLAEYESRPGRDRSTLLEITDAFDFQLLREEEMESRPVRVIHATPRPGYRPRTAQGRLLLPKLEITVWIDKADLNWVRIEAEVIDDITWGLFLVRLQKGARLELRQTRINGEVWLPNAMTVRGTARVLAKKMNMEQDITFKNFRKFQSDSRIVAASETR